MGELRDRLDREWEYIKLLDPILKDKGWHRLKGDMHWVKKRMSIFIYDDIITIWHGAIINCNYLKSFHRLKIETDYIEFIKLNRVGEL